MLDHHVSNSVHKRSSKDLRKQEPKIIEKDSKIESEDEQDTVPPTARQPEPASTTAPSDNLFDDEDRSPEAYQDLIQQFMDGNEVQFEVFETTETGDFKPIFMLGKCIQKQLPPPI